MGQLSPLTKLLNRIKSWGVSLWRVTIHSLGWLGNKFRQLWAFLTVRVPFLRALLRRHLNNPATIFIDIAIFVLSLYLLFGITGAGLIYGKKSESRFSETLAVLYPLPAVKVDSTFIWSHKFLERLRFLTTFNAQVPADAASRPPTDKDLREKIMEGLIEDQIILIEAKKRDISVSEDELNASYNDQKKQTENFEQKIKQLYGMNVTEFRSVLAERILKEKVKSSVLTRVQLRHVLTTSQSAAVEAKKQLDAGRGFADVAKEFSQDKQTKDIGGELGYWTKGELASQIGPALEEAAFSLPIGQISDPIQTQFGFHVIQVSGRTGDNFQTYEDWYKSVEKNYKIHRFLTI